MREKSRGEREFSKRRVKSTSVLRLFRLQGNGSLPLGPFSFSSQEFRAKEDRLREGESGAKGPPKEKTNHLLLRWVPRAPCLLTFARIPEIHQENSRRMPTSRFLLSSPSLSHSLPQLFSCGPQIHYLYFTTTLIS